MRHFVHSTTDENKKKIKATVKMAPAIHPLKLGRLLGNFLSDLNQGWWLRPTVSYNLETLSDWTKKWEPHSVKPTQKKLFHIK